MRTCLCVVAWSAVFAMAGAVHAQGDSVARTYDLCTATYPNGGNCPFVPIPDSPGQNVGGVPAEVTLTIPSDPDGNTILEVIPKIWIQHGYQGDLKIQVISPLGTVVTLVDRPGYPQTIYGFAADDYGGFHQCLPPLSTFGWEAMFFRDQGFCLATGPFVPNRYDSPAVADPGIYFTPPPIIDCAVMSCFGDQWGPWQPETPLSAFIGQSKAGVWRLRVQDFYQGDTGNIRYFGLSIRTITEPNAVITSPTQFSCVCNGTQVIGTANDAGGLIQGYDLEYASSPLGPWTLINSGTSPVINGVLGTWNTSAAPEGQNFLRLTVTNFDQTRTQFTTVAYVDRTFEGINIRSPGAGAIVGGNVCPDGTMTDYCFQSYRVEYAPPPFISFLPVDPANPVYSTPVVNDPLATWNTVSGPAAVVDGTYRLRFTGTTSCGNTGVATRDVIVDNTPPVAVITAPSECTYLCGPVQVVGTVTDAHLSGWVLQYTGGDSHGWVNIASGNQPVVNGVLGVWSTAALRRCAYTLRLIASDSAQVACATTSNTTEYTLSVNVGAYANCDGSTSLPVLNVNDFICFQSQFAQGGACPQ
jgi:subtilisin-like proprotein convertase family protein